MEAVRRTDIKIGFGCNNMCLFCVQGNKREKLGQKKKKLVFEELREGRRGKCSSVVFTGGEPTLNPHLFDFIRYAKAIGYSVIQIQTNGRMFGYPDYCQKLIEAGANEFSPALHGSRAAIHDRLTVSKGSFVQTVKGIKNLKSLGQKVITNTVITKQNYRDLPNIAKLFVRLGVDQFQFAFPHIVGSAMKNKGLIVPTMDKVMPFVKKGLDIGRKNNISAMTEAIPFCFMRGYESCVAERIMPNAIVFDGDYTIKNYKKYRVSKGKLKGAVCKKCLLNFVCEGPWREYPEIFGWKEFSPFLKRHSVEDFDLYKRFIQKEVSLCDVFFLPRLANLVRPAQPFAAATDIKKEWKKYLSAISSKKIAQLPIHFYTHIPFCMMKCEYCMYFKKIASEKEINNYLVHIAGQFKYFSGIFRKVRFQSLYVGGGTPSILSEKQLSYFLKNLFMHFSFLKNGEKSFECNPGSITEGKLQILKKHGFNRISFGVQNTDPEVLRGVNRAYQTESLVKNAVDLARKYGYEVNVDLMIGIKGDKTLSVIKSFRFLTGLDPDMITIYPFKPSKEYVDRYFGGNYGLFNDYLFKEVLRARKMLDIEGKKNNYYRIDRGNELVTSVEPIFYRTGYKSPMLTHYDAVSPLNYKKPQSLFAVGAHATSHIVDNLHYHNIREDFPNSKFDPKIPEYWQLKTSKLDDMRNYILHQYSSFLSLSKNDFRRYFGENIKKFFGKEIALLKKAGKIKEKGDALILPKDSFERYVCALYFLNKKDILAKMIDFPPEAK